MAKVKIPPNAGKVKVAMTLGGKWTVWNGKQGKNEFKILVRTRAQAEQIAALINSKEHGGSIGVLDGGRPSKRANKGARAPRGASATKDLRRRVATDRRSAA